MIHNRYKPTIVTGGETFKFEYISDGFIIFINDKTGEKLIKLATEAPETFDVISKVTSDHMFTQTVNGKSNIGFITLYYSVEGEFVRLIGIDIPAFCKDKNEIFSRFMSIRNEIQFFKNENFFEEVFHFLKEGLYTFQYNQDYITISFQRNEWKVDIFNEDFENTLNSLIFSTFRQCVQHTLGLMFLEGLVI